MKQKFHITLKKNVNKKKLRKCGTKVMQDVYSHRILKYRPLGRFHYFWPGGEWEVNFFNTLFPRFIFMKVTSINIVTLRHVFITERYSYYVGVG